MTTLAPSVEQTGTGLIRPIKLFIWNLSRALIITRREVIDMFRDWRIIAPIVTLTILFPYLANWAAERALRWFGQYGANLIAERLFPFLLMVVGFFPLSFSLIIALESFVGEKERRSLEPLLSTPLTDLQLYIGKMLSSTVPPLVGSMLGISVYLFGLYFNVGWMPPPVLFIQVFLLTITHGVVMVAGAVVVSSQVTSVRAANLLASFIIIPMAFLVQAESYIMLLAQYNTLWSILFALVLITIVLVRMGVRIFNREELLGREIDELNLIKGLRNWFRLSVARRVEGPRRSAWQWYREEVLSVVGRIRGAIVIMVCSVIAGYIIGNRFIDLFPIPTDTFTLEGWEGRFLELLAASGLQGLKGILFVIIQNVRALALASLLAVFTFGVATALVLMLPVAIIGYIVPQVIAAGIDPLVAWMLVIPHSLIEIPAAVLAGAAALRLGASVISPPPGKTVGEGWMEALADATRLWFMLILPLLFVAAIAEVYLTPYLVGVVIGGW